MKKSTKRKIIKSFAALATTTTVAATATLVINLNKLSNEEIKKIISDIESETKKNNDEINLLDENYNSVDTLKIAIENALKNLEIFKKSLTLLNKEDYLKYEKIQLVLNNLKQSISNLETKIETSKIRLNQNIKNLDNVVQNAKQTSEKAIQRLQSTSIINVPGLNEANLELQNALKEVEEAKKQAKDSKNHIDNLVKISQKVQKADQKVKKLIKESEGLTKEQLKDRQIEEIENHINLLNVKIDNSNKENLSLTEIKKLIDDFEKTLPVAIDAKDYIKRFEDEDLLNKNSELEKVILEAEEVLKTLKQKEENLKNKINESLLNIEQKENDSKSKINLSQDFDTLENEFNEANLRLLNEIKNLKNQIENSDFEEAKNKLVEIENKNKQNNENSLNKLKQIVLDDLNLAKYLTEEQTSEFKKIINNAKNPTELKDISKKIKLDNQKAKEILELNKYRNEVKNLLNSENIHLSQDQKNSFNLLLDQANDRQKIDKIKKDFELENKKMNAIKEIEELFKNESDKKSGFEEQINKQTDIDEIDAILFEAKGEKIKVLISKAKANVNKLNWIGDKEKSLVKKEFDNLKTENQIQINLKEIEQKNIDKETLFNSKIKNSEEFEESYIDKIKNDFINEIDKQKYITIQEEFTKLEESKKQIKQRIQKELNFLGDIDKNKFISDLKTKTDLIETKKIEQNASELNSFKQNLIDNLKKLSNLEIQEKNEAENKIKNAISKAAAQQIYDDLLLKSQKESIKKELDTLEDLGSDKQKLLSSIATSKNKQDLDTILKNAKEKNDLNKHKKETINNIKKLNLISENKKRKYEEEINKQVNKNGVSSVFKKAEELNNYKKGKEANNLNLNEIWNETTKNEFNKKLVESETKEKVDSLLEEYSNWNKKVVDAKSEIQNLNNLSQEQKDNFKNQLKGKKEKEIQPIIDNARELDNLEKSKKRVSEIDRLEYLTKSEKSAFKQSIESKNEISDIEKELEKATNTNKFKRDLTNKIDSENDFNLLTNAIKEDFKHKIKTTYEKAEAEQKFNDLKSLNTQKQKILDLITLSNTITSKGKELLTQKLKENDNPSNINIIKNEINVWDQESKKNDDLIDFIKTIKQEILDLFGNNSKIKNVIDDFQPLIDNNIKNTQDTINRLKEKNSWLNNEGIKRKFNNFTDKMPAYFEDIKLNIINSPGSDFIDIDKLIENKIKVARDLDKFESLFNKINSKFNNIINHDKLEQNNRKSKEIIDWINERISLVFEFKQLKNKIESFKKYNRENYEFEIEDALKIKDNTELSKKYNIINQKLDQEISKNITLKNNFIILKKELEKNIKKLKDRNITDITSPTIEELKNSHEQIIKKFEYQKNNFQQEFDNKDNDKSFETINSEIARSNSSLQIYAQIYSEIYDYIESHIDATKKEYKKELWQYFEKMTKESRKILEFSRNNTILESIEKKKENLYKTLDEIKEEIFKQEIINLIGDGYWFKDSGFLKINNAYIDLVSSPKPTIKFVTNKYQSKFYPHMKINFNYSKHEYIQWNKTYNWYGTVEFYSGESKNIKYRLKNINVITRLKSKPNKETEKPVLDKKITKNDLEKIN
ncbi:GA module-containing protein [Metamycoplasma canadense]|uniref:Protein G-related albumin-binding (GA) module domain-containing protein n=1 Tax=Metamycoplasma canadense TaxID=29554 RepID=A0A077L6R9_9BACT|nr:GA module-containing protein [Metamycoplasma canadense]BAP39481.1 hypothetical protein MCAN360_0253 [Metamycoplasma canadense]